MSGFGCDIQSDGSPTYSTPLESAMKLVRERWSKGLESEIISLNGKLSALCLQVKEL
jgi:hypothetical protein